jgi:hypothetical protein
MLCSRFRRIKPAGKIANIRMKFHGFGIPYQVSRQGNHCFLRLPIHCDCHLSMSRTESRASLNDVYFCMAMCMESIFLHIMGEQGRGLQAGKKADSPNNEQSNAQTEAGWGTAGLKKILQPMDATCIPEGQSTGLSQWGRRRRRSAT